MCSYPDSPNAATRSFIGSLSLPPTLTPPSRARSPAGMSSASSESDRCVRIPLAAVGATSEGGLCGSCSAGLVAWRPHTLTPSEGEWKEQIVRARMLVTIFIICSRSAAGGLILGTQVYNFD
jgi:hypothetical protein